jgi:predicted aminopeptidase
MRRLLRRLPRRRSTRGLLFAGVVVVPGFLFAFLFPGCQAVYLGRQALGALKVISGRERIDDRLLSRFPEAEREKLAWVARVRGFAAAELGLEPDHAYTTFYDTHGKPISYIVVAAHPLALEPYQWSFPITGRVPYKGHFSLEEARAERDRLQKDGWDAVWLPVRAFSSLGWFSDPVLSTMLTLPESQLADLLIHELTHRTIYFKNHAELNESLATLVAREGTERLLAQVFGAGSDQLEEYRERMAREDLRDGILDRLWDDLDALYRSRLADPEKLRRKLELFSSAGRALERAGLPGKLEPSNAYLVLDHHYSGLIPLLRAAQTGLGGNPRSLIASLKALKDEKDPVSALEKEIASLSSAYTTRPQTIQLAPRD